MTQTNAATPAESGMNCPRCHEPQSLVPIDELRKECAYCYWQGVIEHFSPPAIVVEYAPAAMPDDITCVYHPNKKAVNICAGTGGYICSLCTLQIDGETYSADYVNRGGLEKAKKKTPYDRTIPRPDHAITLFTFFTIFPYCTALAPLWLGLSIHQYFRHRKMMLENETYARVTRPWITNTMLGLLVLLTLLIVGGFFAFLFAIIVDEL